MTVLVSVVRQALEEGALSARVLCCASTGDTPAAVENYEKLLASHPEYVSGYFQYGQFLAKISRTDDARRILKAGIEAAHRSGDQHAAAEMETALAQL